eukprot:Selendium_serpulae@DN2867_c0_g1_i2.p1
MWIADWLSTNVPQYGGLPVGVNLFIMGLLFVHIFAFIIWGMLMLREFASDGRLASLVDPPRRRLQKGLKGAITATNGRIVLPPLSSLLPGGARRGAGGLAGVELAAVTTTHNSPRKEDASSPVSERLVTNRQTGLHVCVEDRQVHQKSKPVEVSKPTEGIQHVPNPSPPSSSMGTAADDEPTSYFTASTGTSNWYAAAFGQNRRSSRHQQNKPWLRQNVGSPQLLSASSATVSSSPSVVSLPSPMPPGLPTTSVSLPQAAGEGATGLPGQREGHSGVTVRNQ